MGKRWQGILDVLVGANGLAGFDRLTVHYVRPRLDHFIRRAAFDVEVQRAHQLSCNVMILMAVIFQKDIERLNYVYVSDDSNIFCRFIPFPK